MTLSVEQLKAAFKSNSNEGTSRPNNYYPFWNMKEGESATIRFLPDANEDNPMGFLVEKLMHTLTINGENKSVPCLKMYGEECPICKVSSAYYKAEDKANGKKYWRKKQNLAQALIMEDPLPADEDTGENHEGKVRFVALGYQLFNIIKEAFESGELDEVPFAYKGGTDFIIKKTKQGEYSTYAVGSKFARRSIDLDDDTIARVSDEIVDLSTLLPQQPDVEKVEAMLEAALNGGEYEDSSSDTGSSIADKVAAAKGKSEPAAAKVEEATTTTADASDDEFDEEADKILDQIRKRKQAKAE